MFTHFLPEVVLIIFFSDRRLPSYVKFLAATTRISRHFLSYIFPAIFPSHFLYFHLRILLFTIEPFLQRCFQPNCATNILNYILNLSELSKRQFFNFFFLFATTTTRQYDGASEARKIRKMLRPRFLKGEATTK